MAVVRRHPLVTYHVLAIGLSWSWWVPLALAGGEGSHVPGLAGPAIAAVVTSALLGGDRLGALLRRCARWRVRPRLYAAALAPIGVAVVALGIAAVAGGDLPSWTALATFPGIPALGWPGVFGVVLLLNGFGEELGWRGFAWPRLRATRGPVGAAALLVGPWLLWHLPLFWLDTGLGDLRGATILGWAVGLAAGTLVLGWLFERSGGSVLVVALFHASLNMASATAGTAGLPAAAVSGAVIVAAVVLLRHRTTAFAGPAG